jgi:hypothetical protein
MDAQTRGYAPGYDVSPLRGDRHPERIVLFQRQPAHPKNIAPAPNGPAPKGHSMSAQGGALGTGAGPPPPKTHAPGGTGCQPRAKPEAWDLGPGIRHVYNFLRASRASSART